MGTTRPMREATYGWFLRWLKGEGDGSPSGEPPMTTLPERSPLLSCFGGSDVRPDDAIHDLMIATARRRRLGPTSTMSRPTSAAGIRRALGIGAMLASDGHLVRVDTIGGARVERHELRPEDGIAIPAQLVEPIAAGRARHHAGGRRLARR